MEQRAEPPSWLPDGGHPRTGAAADLRNPEADEAAAGTPDGDTEYNFSGSTSYSDGEDTMFGQSGMAADGYSYDPGRPGDATAAIPPYPASLTSRPRRHVHGRHVHGRHVHGRHVHEPGHRGHPRGGGERRGA